MKYDYLDQFPLVWVALCACAQLGVPICLYDNVHHHWSITNLDKSIVYIQARINHGAGYPNKLPSPQARGNWDWRMCSPFKIKDCGGIVHNPFGSLCDVAHRHSACCCYFLLLIYRHFFHCPKHPVTVREETSLLVVWWLFFAAYEKRL